MREYKLDQVTSSLSGLFDAMKAPTWQIAYQPAPARFELEFDLVCRAVKAARRVAFAVEELAFVTKPQKAPPAWRELCLMGRHETHAECTLVGISQRPASIDKDFLSCADVIHCGRLANAPDARAVAPYLGIDWRELTQLPDLAYIERRAGEGAAVRGELSFGNAAKKSSPPKRRAIGVAP